MKKALVIIDVQEGFKDADYWGVRNNPEFEMNVERLLKKARAQKIPVIHIQHLSTEPQSPLRPELPGAAFMPFALPVPGEPVFQKNVNSGFIGTKLEEYLRENKIMELVMVGMTTDHCVSTTARMAANLGFKVSIVADCVATFDKNLGDVRFPAELVHQVSLASLNKEFAHVFTNSDKVF